MLEYRRRILYRQELMHGVLTINVYKCLQMFTNVYKCLQMFTNVYKCLQMFTNVYKCLQMFTNVDNQCYEYIYNNATKSKLIFKIIFL